MKLANNLLAAAAIVLSAEAITMGVKAGLKPSQMCEIINAGTGRNSATQDKFPRAVIPRNFDFGFAIGLSYKDVRLCLQEADELGVPMPTGAAVMQVLAMTKAKYGADADFTLVDLEKERVLRAADFDSYADYNLHEGWNFKGWPVRSISRGVTVMDNHRVVGKGGHGQYLWRRIGQPPLPGKTR